MAMLGQLAMSLQISRALDCGSWRNFLKGEIFDKIILNGFMV
jgi:hypothetical protein